MTGTRRSGGNRWLKHDRSENNGPPVKPMGMTDAWNAKWDELMKQLPQHELRKVDVHQLKSLVTLLLHEQELSAILAKDPFDDRKRRLYLQTVASIGRLSAMFGLSVADRKRLDVAPPPTDDDDEWSD